MQKEKLERLVGRIINHKKYGNVYVKEVVSAAEDKIIGVIESTNEQKTFILSSNYFDNLEDIKFKKKFQEKRPRVIIKKERDLSKYRNHPLLVKIDAQEKYKKKLYSSGIDDEEEDESDEDQD